MEYKVDHEICFSLVSDCIGFNNCNVGMLIFVDFGLVVLLGFDWCILQFKFMRISSLIAAAFAFSL